MSKLHPSLPCESIAQISEQSQLFLTLSVAVIGGLIALTFQVKLHNAKNPHAQISLRATGSLALALVLGVLSICCGFLVLGKLVYAHTHGSDGYLVALSILQSASFVLAFAASAWYLLRNRPLKPPPLGG